jgi:FkbM family methyltransferase
MESFIYATFTNDNNVTIKLPTSSYYARPNLFKKRNEHEVLFRQTVSYLINNRIIKNNIIDLGAWIGDNSIPWAMNVDKSQTIYAIDPSPQNISFIRETAALNNIYNVRTIESAISDRNEVVFTNDDINHAQFSSSQVGKNIISAVTIDYLNKINVIENVDFIHLDVEGFESKVVDGAQKLIDKYRPIITFEQHTTIDDYLGLTTRFVSMKYVVYLINEILPECRVDCRNFIAFPEEMRVDVSLINKSLGKPVLLLMNKTDPEHTSLVATVSGNAMSGNTFFNVKGYKHTSKPIRLYAVHDEHFTKIIATDETGNWVEGRYFLGFVNVSSAALISDAFDSAQGVQKSKNAYNINFS